MLKTDIPTVPIEQWGFISDIVPGNSINLNLTVSSLYTVVCNDTDTTNNPLILSTSDYTNKSFNIYGKRITQLSQNNLWGHWLAVGKS